VCDGEAGNDGDAEPGGDEGLARATPAGADRFTGLNWLRGPNGAPLLTDALACLECEIVAEHAAGDHWIVVGQVDNLRSSPINEPLIFFAGTFGPLK
jgi:3-hydroxy-9,10-secoandrosta-1,3,5(10)-triene-9,17-dione monooxygenase reductase component